MFEIRKLSLITSSIPHTTTVFDPPCKASSKYAHLRRGAKVNSIHPFRFLRFYISKSGEICRYSMQLNALMFQIYIKIFTSIIGRIFFRVSYGITPHLFGSPHRTPTVVPGGRQGVSLLNYRAYVYSGG